MDVASTERENRRRLEQVVVVCERQLQQRTQKAWDASTKADKKALATSLQPFQRSQVAGNVAIDSWDITLCNAVLKQFGALKQKDAKAVAAIVNARNHWAHAAGGRVTTAMFKQHTNACEQALKTLGGDVTALQKLLTSEIDASDASVLTSSPEATALAEAAKLEGNHLFREGDFSRARQCYTRGLQVAGVVDPVVMSYLYNNRATASIRLKEFDSAKEDAKHAAELVPHWAKPHVRLAEIYYETYKPQKAVARLEMALGYATAAIDTACINEIKSKMAEYRLERDMAARRESENLAYGTTHEAEGPMRAATQARQGLDATQNPMDLLKAFTSLDMSGTGLQAKKHVLLGQQARRDGRLADAAREFMAAAVAGDAEGMYNYANYQLKGRGTRKNIPEAVRWLEKAASMPIDDSHMKKLKNVGIGEAMGLLGNLYDGGVHFPQNKTRAREYWERAAALGVNIGLNNFGLCLLNGTHGVKKDLPRARELFRRSAECLHNEAMSNIAALHAALLDYETAARWSDTAAKYGFLPAAGLAEHFRELAKEGAPMPEAQVSTLKAYNSQVDEMPTTTRLNETPSVEELRAIGTPYGDRLLAAKEMIGEAMKAMKAAKTSNDPNILNYAMALVVQANLIDDSELVFSKEEVTFSFAMAKVLQEDGAPAHPALALLTKPTDPSSATAFWTSLQHQFPEDLAIAKRAACMLCFEAYPGHDFQRAVQLFQHAFSLLPKPDDDSDPHTLDLLYLTGVAYYHVSDFSRAEAMLTRFLAHAPADGHRKASEATYFMGEIAMVKLGLTSKALDKVPLVAAKYLEEGDRLLQQIPAFLRDAAGKSPHRAMLQRISSSPGGRRATSTPAASEAPSPSHRRGGELIGGPGRLEVLRSNSPMLQKEFRANIAAMAPMPEAQVSALKAYNSRVDEKPTTTRQNETPSIDELRAIGTPYGNRLLAAKEMIAKAMKAPRDVREMAGSVLFAVQANRIEDSGLVFSNEETVFSSTVAETLLYAGVPVNAGVALLTKPTDPSSAITFWTSLQRQFPEDLAIAKRAACMLSFEAYPGHDFQRALRLFQHAFSLLPKPDDDSDPHTLDLLYLTGVAYYHVSDFSRAEAMVTRFLAHAPADGHRKASEATYFMGEIAMMKLGSSPQAQKKAPRVAAKYLEEGDRLLEQIPTFLRDDAEKSPHRAMLQRISSLPGGRPATSPQVASEAVPLSRRRGGELIEGPRRLEELRTDSPTLQKELRANIAAMASGLSSRTSMTWSTPPARKPATKRRHHGSYSRATIDELFSALEDRVYTKRVLNCIVVSLPSFNGSSFQFVVEDSQREPSRIALYNAPQSLIAQLTPGREFELWDPYVRLAMDGSIMLRVDDPATAIEVKALHVICWVCSLEQTAEQQPKRCAKCHKATYCSKACQTHDWRVDGHRVLCSVVAKMN